MLSPTGDVAVVDDAPGPQPNTPMESLARHSQISELSFELSGSSEPNVHAGSQANQAESGSEMQQEQAREGFAEWSEAQWPIELEAREVLRQYRLAGAIHQYTSARGQDPLAGISIVGGWGALGFELLELGEEYFQAHFDLKIFPFKNLFYFIKRSK